MKILHINQSDIEGGAAIAGYRLHQGLLAQGINSRMLVSTKQTTSNRVNYIPTKQRISNHIRRFTKYLDLNYIHLVGSFNISKHDFFQEADVLIFHNLHSGNFNYLAIPSLTIAKPTIFTLHDMWSFTGHCAYSYDCHRWQMGCGKCPYPNTYPEIQKDNTNIEWQLKKWIYHRSNLTIVTPSHWLTMQAQCSMLNHFPIHHIPYGIDTEAYKPLDPEQCRAVLGIAVNKKVLMFGAQSLTDPRKGTDLLLKALQSLPESLKAEIVLLTIGGGEEAMSELMGIATINLGYVTSDRLKSIAYSAADLFIFPTRDDNLPLVLQESMACATPMISFKVGGVPDLVRPGTTGYLAVPEDTHDFCDGIVELLEDESLRHRMGRNCREIALAEYPLELQIKRYMGLVDNL